MRQSHKTILLWGVLILMFYLIYSIVSSSRAEVQEVAFSDFLGAVTAGNLKGTEVESATTRSSSGPKQRYARRRWASLPTT